MKNLPDFIKKILYKKDKEAKQEHIDASNHRKKIIPIISKELNFLAEELHLDRIVLFEYTNGRSNLIGLPFLYASATSEVARSSIRLISNFHQRINISLFADFLIDLETKGYFYFKNIEDIKDKYSVIYRILKNSDTKSALFYSLFSDQESIGFLLLSTEKTEFERDKVLSRAAATAQSISSLLNYDNLKHKIE